MNKTIIILLAFSFVLATASPAKRRPVKEMSIARKKASKSKVK